MRSIWKCWDRPWWVGSFSSVQSLGSLGPDVFTAGTDIGLTVGISARGWNTGGKGVGGRSSSRRRLTTPGGHRSCHHRSVERGRRWRRCCCRRGFRRGIWLQGGGLSTSPKIATADTSTHCMWGCVCWWRVGAQFAFEKSNQLAAYKTIRFRIRNSTELTWPHFLTILHFKFQSPRKKTEVCCIGGPKLCFWAQIWQWKQNQIDEKRPLEIEHAGL